MIYVLAGLLVIGLYLFIGHRRRGAFIQKVTRLVELSLKNDGEADSAIRAYVNSMAFSVIAKSSFGKSSPYAAAARAIGDYEIDPEKWHRIGNLP